MHGETWPVVAVVGAGAVGCFFGGMLARAGARVTFIGRSDRVLELAREGLFIDSPRFTGRVGVSAANDPAAVRGADLVLLAVKTVDTEDASRTVQPYLGPDVAFMSLQNGVDNVERIKRATNVDAIAAAVYVAASMSNATTVKHVGRGELIIGRPEDARAADDAWPLQRIAGTFERATVPCQISNHIDREMWTKMAMNCAWNGISALGRSTYGRAVQDAATREVVRDLVEEVAAVGRAAGIQLSVPELFASAIQLAESVPLALSSTAQDIARGRKTEIDSLNGYIVSRGTSLGVPTPVNRTVHALVQLLERAASSSTIGSVLKDEGGA
jgi:2-dehydropantoate 2-reductase